MIKAIIFDIGGVIFDESSSPQYEDIAQELNISLDIFISVKDKHLALAKINKISIDELMNRISRELNLNKDHLLKIWTSKYKKRKINKNMINLVKNLKKRYKVIVLSNTNELHAKINYERGLYSIFDKVFLSNELKMAKPDKKIFQYVLKSLKLKPEECVFIDDKEDNVNVANELGINGIVFIDYNNLLINLQKYNITLK